MPSTRKPQSRLDNEPLARSWVWDKEMEIIIWGPSHQSMLHSRFPFHVSKEKSAVQNRWIWSGKKERQVGLGDVIPDLRPTQHLMFQWGRAGPVPAEYLSPDPTGATIHASTLFNHLISALSSGKGTAGVEVAGPEGNTSGTGPTEASDGAIVNTIGHVLLYIQQLFANSLFRTTSWLAVVSPLSDMYAVQW